MWWLLVGPAFAFVDIGETLAAHTVVGIDRQSDHMRVFLNSPSTGDVLVDVVRTVADPSTHTLVAVQGSAPAPLTRALTEKLRAHEATDPTPLTVVTVEALPTPAPTPPPRTRPVRTPAPRVWRLPTWPAVTVHGVSAFAAALGGALLTALVGRVRRRSILRVLGGGVLLALLGLMLQVLLPLDQPFATDDQTQRIFAATFSVDDIVHQRYSDNRHPFLLFLILHGLLNFGMSEALMRLPAVVAALGAVVTVFALFRKPAGLAAAVAATAALALNPEMLARSREVGDHTLFVFLSLGAVWALLRALDRPTAPRLALVVVAEVLMLSASYTAILVVVAHAVLAAIVGIRRGGRAGLAPVVAIAIALFVVQDVLAHFGALIEADRGARLTAEAFPTHMWGDLAAARMTRLWLASLAASPAMVDLLVVGSILALLRSRDRLAPALALTLAIGLPAMAIGADEVRLKAYYLLFLTPVLTGLAALGLRPGRRLPSQLLGGAALGLLLHGTIALHVQGRSSWQLNPTDQWARLQQVLQDRDAQRIVADPNSMHSLMLYYGHPDPIGAYPHCVLPNADMGTRCEHGGAEIVTLTSIPELSDGWERRAVDRLTTVAAPYHFIYTRFFPNTVLLGILDEDCDRLVDLNGGDTLLFWCPDGVRPPI